VRGLLNFGLILVRPHLVRVLMFLGCVKVGFGFKSELKTEIVLKTEVGCELKLGGQKKNDCGSK